jgi:hypothetical protein
MLYNNWLPNIWRRLIYTNLYPLLATDGISGWSWKPEQQQLITIITPDNSYDRNLVRESFFLVLILLLLEYNNVIVEFELHHYSILCSSFKKTSNL